MLSAQSGLSNIQQIYEESPYQFPDIPSDYFQLKDKNIIGELEQLQTSSKQMINPIQHLGGTIEEQASYRVRQDKLINLLEQLNQPSIHTQATHTPYKSFDYYNLEDTNFDEKQNVQDGLLFLQQLRKQKESLPKLSNDFEKMTLEFKPTFQQKYGEMDEEKGQTKKITQQIQLLSFQDENQ